MPSPTDSELLERARQGDSSALETLLLRYQASIYRFGMRMCRDPEDARDVAQETLLAMARGVRDFRGASSLSTWLYTIARSYCLKKRRKSKFAPAESALGSDDASLEALVTNDSRSPDEALAGKEIERELERAIRELEPMYREVLLLRDVEGLTAPEVAAVVGASVQAVKSRLHRARKELREHLAPLFALPDSSARETSLCPDVPTLFSQHLEGDISQTTCADMERHLEQCSRCRGACDALKRTLSLCRTIPSADAVPASVQASVKVALKDFLSHNP